MPAPSPAPAPTPAPIDTTGWFTQAPQDWRNSFVEAVPEADRPVAKSFFERVPSLPVLAHNYVEAQKRISKGLPPDNVPYLPKDHTPEQLAAYRKAIDVPETADKYELALDQGLVLGEEDRKMYAPVFATLHAANVPTPVVSALVNEYLKLDQNYAKGIALQDEKDKSECTLAMKKLWGVDYERNMGLIEMLLQDMPEATRKEFMHARMPGNRALFNTPEVLQFLLSKQAEINPMATVVPQSGSDGIKAIETEIAALEKRMGSDPTWFQDEKAQQRYRDLITAQEQLRAKK